MKIVLLFALVCVVGSSTLDRQGTDEDSNESEQIIEGDMILTKEQIKELYGEDQDGALNNNPGERKYSNRDDGAEIHEGDMILTKHQVKDLYGNAQGRNYLEIGTFAGTVWPGGIVQYDMDNTITKNYSQAAIAPAIRHWEENTCIKFVNCAEKRCSGHRARFTSSTGCLTNVGKINSQWNVQFIQLAENCEMGAVAHEIGHTIGFAHEQSRVDRDKFVTVLEHNIEEGKKGNFQVYNSLHNYKIGYDYGSLMHYGMAYFSKNGKNTIVPNDAEHTLEIGNREKLSFLDKTLANLMYNCSAHCNPNIKCENNGFVDKTCRCQCPEGYSGGKCQHFQTVAPACGGTFTTEAKIKSPKFISGRETKCMWRFKAPPGKVVSIWFKSFHLRDHVPDDNTCYFQTLDVRGEGYDGEETYCGKKLAKKTLVMKGNQNYTYIMYKALTDEGFPGFEATVTFV